MLDGVGVELAETLEQKEELCQNVLIVLLSIMWKGIEGASLECWKVSTDRQASRQAHGIENC